MSDDGTGADAEQRHASDSPDDEAGAATGSDAAGISAGGDWTGDRDGVEDPSELTYVESQVIMTTVRVVAPFALTYGLFLMFHGADSPGGSFQGGAIIGSTVLMVAFAFGIAPTRDWLRNRTVVALAAGGTAVFTLVGLVPMAFGDSFLAHPFYEEQFGIDTKWGLEAIEIGGVAPIVAGVVIGLFFVIAAGALDDSDDAADTAPDGGAVRPDGGAATPATADSGPAGGSSADVETDRPETDDGGDRRC